MCNRGMDNPKVSYIRTHGEMADGDRIPTPVAVQVVKTIEGTASNMERFVTLKACMSFASAKEYLRRFGYTGRETEQEKEDKKTEARVRRALAENKANKGTPLVCATKETIEALLRRIDRLSSDL